MRRHTHSPETIHTGHISTAAHVPPEMSAGNYELRRGAKALVTSRGRALLVKERRSDGSSFWSLPGGGVERDESTQECLKREIVEEIRCWSSVGSAVDSCIYCHTNRPAATVYTVFEVTLETNPEPNPTEGIVDHAWRRPTDLPTTTLLPIAKVVANAVPHE
ncbi:NUDIX domain-containing protein [Halobellus ordinarius]|uniref:NUDIX domain-containing protein n=1 Tax=Halobellus ordinarius TaxID=3075120 RepID=UPI002880367C|nr:NUDIX domain-containing protein [Halobellus sp. ZY16]